MRTIWAARCLLAIWCSAMAQGFRFIEFDSYFLPLRPIKLFVRIDEDVAAFDSRDIFYETSRAVESWTAIPGLVPPLHLQNTSDLFCDWIWRNPNYVLSKIHFHRQRQGANSYVAFTNFSFSNEFPMLPVRSEVHVYLDTIPDLTTLYNIVLHEIGHVLLLHHPKSSTESSDPNELSFYYLISAEDEVPVMGQKGTLSGGILRPQTRSNLQFDDVAGAMYRSKLYQRQQSTSRGTPNHERESSTYTYTTNILTIDHVITVN